MLLDITGSGKSLKFTNWYPPVKEFLMDDIFDFFFMLAFFMKNFDGWILMASLSTTGCGQGRNVINLEMNWQCAIEGWAWFHKTMKGWFYMGHWLGGIFLVEEEQWVWIDGTNFDSKLWNKDAGTVGNWLSLDCKKGGQMISKRCFEHFVYRITSIDL